MNRNTIECFKSSENFTKKIHVIKRLHDMQWNKLEKNLKVMWNEFEIRKSIRHAFFKY